MSNLKNSLAEYAFEQDPGIVRICLDTLNKLQNNFFNKGITDALFQKQTKRNLDIYDAYYFSILWSHIMRQEILIYELHIGVPPFPDKEVDKNNEILSLLSKATDGEFEAEFIPMAGRGDNDDGYFKWNKNLVIENEKGNDIIIPPNTVSLEVGTTDIFTTYDHLLQYSQHNAGLARWPYNSNTIYLFITSNNLLDNILNKAEATFKF